MKAAVHWGTAAVVLVAANVLIAHKEHVLGKGRTVLLRLAPGKARSGILSDCIVLKYDIARRVPESELKREPDGRIVVRLDRDSVARFVRLHRGGSLAEGEQLLRYRYRGSLRLGAESFFFREEDAEHYGRARYAELRVSLGGRSVLVGLRDRHLAPLGPRAGSEDG